MTESNAVFSCQVLTSAELSTESHLRKKLIKIYKREHGHDRYGGQAGRSGEEIARCHEGKSGYRGEDEQM